MNSLGVRSIAGWNPSSEPSARLDKCMAAAPLAEETSAFFFLPWYPLDFSRESEWAPDLEIAAGCRYSKRPSRPPSRPNPLSRYPPNPEAASKTLVQLIQIVPAFMPRATSRARLMLSLQMLAASP